MNNTYENIGINIDQWQSYLLKAHNNKHVEGVSPPHQVGSFLQVVAKTFDPEEPYVVLNIEDKYSVSTVERHFQEEYKINGHRLARKKAFEGIEDLFNSAKELYLIDCKK
jgi:hypothetical protein